MTSSAFELKDDLSPWTISDFEILLNPQNKIVATNPGQFYYHQRVTNSFPSTTAMDFVLDWPAAFATQTTNGQPLHAYVQLVGDPMNTWRDWTGQSTGICWSSTPAANCGGHDATITVRNVPTGAKVWITAHLDYYLKGSTVASNFTQKPVTYTPFMSVIAIKDQATSFVVGTSSSSESLLGRGKKVTAVYGALTSSTGVPIDNVWVRFTQGSNTATARTGADGTYLVFDGQGCALADGLEGGCTGASSLAWNFANGTASGTFAVFGSGATPSGTPTYPAGYTKFKILSNGSTVVAQTTIPPTITFNVAKGSAYNRDWLFTP